MNNKKKIRKTNNRRILVYIFVLFFVVLALINLNSKRTLVLKSEDYIKKYDTKTFLLKDEQVFYFDQKPSYDLSEGTKVSKNQLLSTKSLTLNSYANQKLKAINLKVDFSGGLEEIVDLALKSGLKDKDVSSQTIDEFLLNLDGLKYSKFDVEQLESEKSKIENLLQGSFINGISLNKINASCPGYVFYSLDGYEQIFDISNIEDLIDLDFEDLNIVSESLSKNIKNVLKVVNDDSVYIWVPVPHDLETDWEESMIAKKLDVIKNLDNETSIDYLERLYSRVDILRSMPKVDFASNDVLYTAYAVDVFKNKSNKAYLFQIKENVIKEILSKRSMDIELITYRNKGYLIPEKSILEKDGKNYIVVLNKGYLRKLVEVFITEIDEDKVFLSRSENNNISEGMQLIINP
ncbi:HlyD family efflux transporter periplasmic adaptor subunit [Alkalibacter mobilis]|uniref:HlyD family efflux transporter periplasmic adaptor subunit n=1 Tax=Alkalibacter mobilis TaxID=2787712 RepID=UPI00189F3C19|nr:HlyD family efflux transporter periplasmic adaptor subunit [Alkalibacter mobilis]MBF7095872.1 hypothetical protein [Alkalibacter mobilis]